MLVKVNDGQIVKFPYSTNELKAENPSVSFPANISEDILNSYGVYTVTEVELPVFDKYTQRITKSVINISGVWTANWDVTDLPQEEAEVNVRAYRNRLLSNSDWTQVADAPVDKTAWATYRQALRDITTHANFPNLNDSDWPTKPA